MAKNEYDLIVIGSGGVGSTAASMGMLGGTCLNDGCDPTKTLLPYPTLADAVRWTAVHLLTLNLNRRGRYGIDTQF